MQWLKELAHSLSSIFRRSHKERELSEELQFHLELQIEENIARGMSPQEARYAALRLFGGVQQIKEECRDMRRVDYIENFLQDVRYGSRMLAKNSGFTTVAVLTLALGIGATTAIFSVVDRVLLRPLPYRNASRLVSLYEDRSGTGFPRKLFTPANFVDCKTQTVIFEDVAAIDADRFYNLTGNGARPERLSAEGVTHNLFSILGVQPLVGRFFLPEEDTAGSEHVVLLSHRLWLNRFGGDRKVLGQGILLNGQTYSVIGIMPPWFSFPNRNADLWVPTAFTAQDLADRGSHFLTVIAALQPGVTVARANAELRLFSQNLRRQHMDIMQFVDGFVAVPLQEVYTRDVRGGLISLLVAVGLVLLIACVNIANLLLSRAGVRRREIALRGALGATRDRILRQLLTESALIATAGGAVGVFLAHSSFNVLKFLIPADLSRTISLDLNLSVLGVAVLISFASTFLFGLVPALRISKTEVNDSLKEGGLWSTGRRKGLGNWLVAGEIALCLMLLVGSGLLLESLVNLRSEDPGFRSDHVLTLGIPVSRAENPDFTRRSQFFQTVLERVRALPGVTKAGFTSVLPMTWKSAMGGFSGMAGFLPEGLVRPDVSYGALDRVVSPGYFEAMRIPLLRGRLLDDRDRPGAPLVAVVNETMATKFWPNQDVLGKRFRLVTSNGPTPWIQIVGVVGDVKQMGLDEPSKEEMYFPYWQAMDNYMDPSTLVIRTTGDPASLAAAVRRAVWSIDPDQPVSDVMTMDDVLDREVEARRAQAVLLGSFATLAVTLACVGIYGVMAYFISQRNHEFGVRIALGACTGSIFRLVLARGAILTATGLAVGIGGALAVTQLMRGLLYGVSPMDPLTITGASVLLTLVAIAACYIPARRAMRVDPMVALRYE